MDETPEQKFERISEAVQDSILRNYPNPERKGCSSDRVIREVAGRAELQADELWEHITHCSPCYAIFLRFKNEIRREKIFRRRTVVGSLALASLAILLLVISRFFVVSYDRQIGDWNLEASASLRGAEDEKQNAPSAQRASREQGYLRVHLPLGSEGGEYHLQIRQTEDGAAVKEAVAKAEIVNGQTQVSFHIDLRRLTSGAYFAAIRGSSRVWRVYPLHLA